MKDSENATSNVATTNQVVKGDTVVMQPVKATPASTFDVKNYSVSNTQPKRTRKQKKADWQRKKMEEEKLSKEKEAAEAKAEAERQAKAEAIAQAAVQAKDPNKKFFVIGSALIAFGLILFVCIAAFGFPYFYNQGATTANQLNEAKTSYTPTSTYKDSTEGSASTSNTNENKTSSDETAKTETTLASDTTCQHEWEEVRQTIHHDPVTHEVNHEAQYRTVTKYHTVCNVCNEKIDNQIAEHKEKTGHYSWSTNVPFEEKELVSEAYTQTVTDQDAWDEQIVMGRKCKKCGTSELYD